MAASGSLKGAADTLALSSPAVTRRIQALEQFVGIKLFEREHNAVLLNAQGRDFLAEVGPQLEALTLAVERLGAPAKAMRLRIAVPSLFASQRLVPAFPSLRARHPTLQVELDTRPNRLGRLNDGIDAAIAIAAGVDDKLYSRFVERGRIIAIGSRSLMEGPEPVVRPSDLARVPILLHRSMPENFAVWCKSVGLQAEPAVVNHFDSGQLMLDSAAEGLGVAFMLESHLKSSSDERLVKMFDQAVDGPYSYWFVCPPSALTRRPVRVFHDWLFEAFSPDDGFSIAMG